MAYSGTDADLAADGQQVDLSAGRNAVTVTVTAQDGSTTETYTVSVNRGVTDDYGWKAVDDLDGLIAAGNLASRGIWSDGTTMWVTDWDDDKLYAYNTDGTRDSSKDFNTLAGAGNRNPSPASGPTATPCGSPNQKTTRSTPTGCPTRSATASKDFNTLVGAGNRDPRGIWSDGDTMWVADDSRRQALRLQDVRQDPRQPARTSTRSGTGIAIANPAGIWSDGDTMWVADPFHKKLYAYRMSDKTRDASKDFNTLSGAGNNKPTGIWSDGDTMWVADLLLTTRSIPTTCPQAATPRSARSRSAPTDIIGFAPDRTAYEVGVASTETRATVAADRH